MCQFRISGWKLRVYFNRKTKQQSSDFFQNLISFYLRNSLTNNYQVNLESPSSDNKLKVDVVITKNKAPIFAIEVKTNIGWDRIREKHRAEDEEKYNNRINEIAKSFNIKKKNVIYILETPKNTNKFFETKYWNDNSRLPRSKEMPYSNIFPLFYSFADPYYWEEYKDIENKDESIPEIKKKDIVEKFRGNLITPFEDIIRMIKSAK